MAEITVRDIPEDVLALLERQARQDGMSVDDEVRDMLVSHFRKKADRLDHLRTLRAESRPDPEGLTAVDLLRQDRDSH